MSLEEDAMLVAIGYMSMEEAREKWADQWSEFMQSLSRWKSIHQLFRLGKLASQMRKMAKLFHNQVIAEVDAENAVKTFETALAQVLAERGQKPTEDTFMHLYNNVKEAVESDPTDQIAKHDFKNVSEIKERLDKLRKDKDEATGRIESTKIKYMEANDQYEITKPYAMGLLVADVFYSLSAALEGDIY